MTNINHTKSKLTLNRGTLQLKLNLNYEYELMDDGKVSLVQNIVERIDSKKLTSLYSKKGRKPIIDPITMLEILIFCYSEKIFSSRDIEKMCKYDLRVKYLLDDQKAPDHVTINRFRHQLEPIIEELLFDFSNILLDTKHVDLSSIYIDGTKIEAYANKYTFVWKKSILKFQEKLRNKICKEFNLDKDISLVESMKVLNSNINALIDESKDIVFVYGAGKRKTLVQKKLELYQDWKNKLSKYEQDLKIMGERNSYSKTDHDATFMRMKDDHMKNGQLKPGYNIQFASSGQFIVGVYGSHHPSDMHTLPLFLDKIMPTYKYRLDKIVCDSGYESIENYIYLKKHKLKAFIKPANYERSKTRKYKKDISKYENMVYDKENDFYLCANNKKLIRQKDQIRNRASGISEKLRVYRCIECDKCPLSKECQKHSKKDNPQTKTIKYSDSFDRLRKESFENITSYEGIIERLNRSIQAEGMFSKLKEGLNYTRFRHRGLRSIICDITLAAMGLNLNELNRKLQKNISQVIKYKHVS